MALRRRRRARPLRLVRPEDPNEPSALALAQAEKNSALEHLERRTHERDNSQAELVKVVQEKMELQTRMDALEDQLEHTREEIAWQAHELEQLAKDRRKLEVAHG